MDALAQLLKLLGGRDKTRAQAAEALRRRGHPDEAVEAALDRAGALGYLDDQRVARRLALDALRDGWTGEALVAKLGGRGVDEALARRALDEAVEALSWSEPEAAREVVARRRLTGARAARFLLSRGFSEDVSARFWNR